MGNSKQPIDALIPASGKPETGKTHGSKGVAIA
jgi:hypothetical protein